MRREPTEREAMKGELQSDIQIYSTCVYMYNSPCTLVRLHVVQNTTHIVYTYNVHVYVSNQFFDEDIS